MLKTLKTKYVIIVAAIILLLVLLFRGQSVEKTAQQFVENMLDGNAKGCVALLTDDAIARTGAATRKLLINEMDKAFQQLQDDYKAKYGKKWKYEISVIDSYEYESEYYDGEYIGNAIAVVVEIQHTGKGLLNDKEGTETETLVLVPDGQNWLVAGFGS